MIDPQDDPTAVALAHDEVLAVVAPDGVEAAISTVMARHRDELDVALKPYGLELRDLLQPAWMRIVRVGDVEAFRSVAEVNADLDAAASRAADIADLEQEERDHVFDLPGESAGEDLHST